MEHLRQFGEFVTSFLPFVLQTNMIERKFDRKRIMESVISSFITAVFIGVIAVVWAVPTIKAEWAFFKVEQANIKQSIVDVKKTQKESAKIISRRFDRHEDRYHRIHRRKQ